MRILFVFTVRCSHLVVRMIYVNKEFSCCIFISSYNGNFFNISIMISVGSPIFSNVICFDNGILILIIRYIYFFNFKY